MRLSEDQRQQITQLKDSIDRNAGWLADLALETGRRDFVMASSQLQAAKMILLTILAGDKDEELNGPKEPEGPQLVGRAQGN